MFYSTLFKRPGLSGHERVDYITPQTKDLIKRHHPDWSEIFTVDDETFDGLDSKVLEAKKNYFT